MATELSSGLIEQFLVVQQQRPIIFVAHSLGGLICVKVC